MNNNKQSLFVYGNKQENIKYSIYIPTYKRPLLLKQSLYSAINQIDFSNYEILVVDNDPEGDDEVLNVIKEYNDQRVLYYRNSSNLGMVGNWNAATKLCSGKIIIHLADDDVLSQHYMKTINTIIDDNFYGVLGVEYIKISDNNYAFEPVKNINLLQINLREFFFGKTINITGMLYSRDFYDDCGGFDENFYPITDSVFISEAAKKNALYKTDAVIAGYRIDDQNATLKNNTLELIIEKYEQLRINISNCDKKVFKFMKRFNLEYLDIYIDGAEQYWKKQVDRKAIYAKFGLKNKPSKLKKIIVKLIIKIFY